MKLKPFNLFLFFRFFTDLNDLVFKTIFEAENTDFKYYSQNFGEVNLNEANNYRRSLASQPTKLVQNDLIKKMGLDPSDDKDFTNELIRFYDFNLKVV